MSTLVRRAMLALALVGFASAATSTYVHYQIASDPGYTSFCDINERVSCTQVYLSRFGSVGGTPVALLGAFWFGVVGLLLASVAAVACWIPARYATNVSPIANLARYRRRACRSRGNARWVPENATTPMNSSDIGRMIGRNRRAIQKCSGTMRIL